MGGQDLRSTAAEAIVVVVGGDAYSQVVVEINSLLGLPQGVPKSVKPASYNLFVSRTWLLS